MANDLLDPMLKNSPEFDSILAANKPMEEPKPLVEDGFDFKSLQEKVKNLAGQWAPTIEKCKKNRLLRNMEVDNEAERQRGRFKPHEIYIPYHVVNDNISKESSSYINFVVSSRNAAVFKVRNSSAVESMEQLERVFTSAVRYEGYEQELFATIDGHQLHGLDYLEIEYDESKPGYFKFEQLGYENVWYPQNVQRGKFQSTPILVRNCEITKQELLDFPNVDKMQVELLFNDAVKNDPTKDFICIQKVFYRKDGAINVCWMNYEKSTNFLRAPQPLFLGRWKRIIDEFTGIELSRTPIYENFYTTVPFPYSITENKNLVKTLGRAALDENTQEAVSSMVSCIVNAYHKASQVFWSPRNPTSTGEIEQLDIVLEDGRGLNQPVDFFSHPYPNADGMNLVNALITQNKSETAQQNMAVGNRNDYASRKTAKEVDVAEKMTTQLSTTQVVLFSQSWTETLNICFLIWKAQVEIGTITVEGLNPALLQRDLVLTSAGITEVMQRQETLQNLQNLWPIISGTPAAVPVLEDIIRLMIPSSADKYIQAMQMAVNNDKALIQGLATIVQAIAQEHPEAIPQENYEQLGQLLQAAKQSASQPAIGQPPLEETQNESSTPAPANA